MNQVTDQPFLDFPGLKGQQTRAAAIAQAGGLQAALAQGLLSPTCTVSLSEGLVLGLLKQGVRKYLAIFGHGSTDLGEVLRVYEAAGVTQSTTSATRWRWRTRPRRWRGTTARPAPWSPRSGRARCRRWPARWPRPRNGVGVYHIYGDETTHGEGHNMQQIPKHAAGPVRPDDGPDGPAYVLHTPEALRDALRRGTHCVHHPYQGRAVLPAAAAQHPAGAVSQDLNLDALPERLAAAARWRSADDAGDWRPRRALHPPHARIVDQGGRRRARPLRRQVRALAEAIGAAVVLSPGSHRRGARRPPAEHARRRQQGVDQRQLRDGSTPTC